MSMISQENKLIDMTGLNRFRIGDHVVADACADHDRFEGVVIGIGLQRVYFSRVLHPSITLLHDGDQITDGFRPDDLRKVSDFDARIRSALVERKAEPVAWLFEGAGWGKEVMFSHQEALDRKERLSRTWDIEITPLYSTPPAAAVTGLDGWQLVPKEPTELMKVLGCEYADPLGRLIGWDPSKGDCTTRDDVAGVYKAMLSSSPSPVDSRDDRDFLRRLIENAFSWALQDCNYLNPKYMDRLIDCTHDGMKPEQAAIWNATAPSPVGDRDALIERLDDTCPRTGLPHAYWPQGQCQYCGALAPAALAAREQQP